MQGQPASQWWQNLGQGSEGPALLTPPVSAVTRALGVTRGPRCCYFSPQDPRPFTPVWTRPRSKVSGEGIYVRQKPGSACDSPSGLRQASYCSCLRSLRGEFRTNTSTPSPLHGGLRIKGYVCMEAEWTVGSYLGRRLWCPRIWV